jgi:hypothetical protein
VPVPPSQPSSLFPSILNIIVRYSSFSGFGAAAKKLLVSAASSLVQETTSPAQGKFIKIYSLKPGAAKPPVEPEKQQRSRGWAQSKPEQARPRNISQPILPNNTQELYQTSSLPSDLSLVPKPRPKFATESFPTKYIAPEPNVGTTPQLKMP